MFRKDVAAYGLPLLLLAVCCGTGRAATLLVGTSAASCPNAQYNTIGAAISAANSGDEVDVCPGLYPEQLIITKPLTLKGIAVNSVSRVLLQPSPLVDLMGLTSEAVITVMNTRLVTIQNLAIDASNNTLTGCGINVVGIHYYNATGAVLNNAIFGAQLQKPTSCPNLFPGTGQGVLVDVDDGCGLCRFSPLSVSVDGNSIHDFGRNGILAMGAGLNLEASGNSITGAGPSLGTLQFGIFVALGAVGQIRGNFISQQGCGTLAAKDCFNLRSEGIVLRLPGDGTVIDGNTITTAQFGLFLNVVNAAVITNNIIRNISSAGSGMQLQSVTNSVFDGNIIFGVGPINQDPVAGREGCGINELSLLEGAPPGSVASSGNIFRNNTISDAYCGVGYVTGDAPVSGTYLNTLYATLNNDQLAPNPFPPAAEPQ